MKVAGLIALLCCLSVPAQGADRPRPGEPPVGCKWTESFTPAEFERRLDEEAEKLVREQQESPFLVSIYPTRAEWRKKTGRLGAFEYVWLFEDDGSNSSGWAFGIAVQRADRSVAIVTEDRGYKAHYPEKKGTNRAVDPTPGTAPPDSGGSSEG